MFSLYIFCIIYLVCLLCMISLQARVDGLKYICGNIGCEVTCIIHDSIMNHDSEFIIRITRKLCGNPNRMLTKYSGTPFIRTPINQTLHLLNLLDSQKIIQDSHIIISTKNMASSHISSSLLSSNADVSSKKCKRKVVSIKKKLEIYCRHKMGQSYTSLSKECGLGKSTIVQSEDRLIEYMLEIQHASGPNRSIIRRSKYDKLDKAPYLWFLQKRAMGTSIYGLILTAKAKIYKKLYGSSKSSVTDTKRGDVL